MEMLAKSFGAESVVLDFSESQLTEKEITDLSQEGTEQPTAPLQ
jgi:hypothetical protein